MTFTRIGTTAAALAASTSFAFAAPVVGLVDEATLVMFDTENPAVTSTMEVSGVEMLHGIDVRPADGMIYGVTSANTIVTIDPETGEATEVSTLNTEVPMADSVAVDFNPVADRLRIVSGTTNLRVNVDSGEVTTDGELNWTDGDANADATSDVVAVAYTNSVGSPEATAMYDLDAGLGALLQQTAPNDGTLATIGELGIDGGTTHAFDIEATEVDMNTAYLATGGMLYTVDLETGAATEVGEIADLDGDLRDIAVMPAM
jgi:outer membrane protein assembly factor BamB